MALRINGGKQIRVTCSHGHQTCIPIVITGCALVVGCTTSSPNGAFHEIVLDENASVEQRAKLLESYGCTYEENTLHSLYRKSDDAQLKKAAIYNMTDEKFLNKISRSADADIADCAKKRLAKISELRKWHTDGK